MRQYLSVYIYNSVEDEWSYINGLKNKKERETRITLSNAYADCYLFSNSEKKQFIFISPVPVSPDFVSYFEQLTGSQVTVIVPKMNHPFISECVVKDKIAFNRIISEASKYGGINLYSYAASPSIYKLKKHLERQSINVVTPETPEEKNYWSVPVFGSKSGFRKLINKINKKKHLIHIPEGTVFSSPVKAVRHASSLLLKQKSVLVKIDKGSGGHGTFILTRGKAGETKQRITDHILRLFGDNPLWRRNNIVVEEYIETDNNISVRFPSIEGYVDYKGKHRILYTCNMLVTDQGNFFGMETGKGTLPKTLESKMKKYLRLIGNIYARAGYRGHFDVDMLYGTDKKLYVNESNIRNTGGTDAYKLSLHLLGKEKMNSSFVLSKYVDFPPHAQMLPFDRILKLLSPVLYDTKIQQGVIVSSESSLRERSLTYFIIARSKNKAYWFEKQLLAIIHTNMQP